MAKDSATSANFPYQPAAKDPWPAKPDPYRIGRDSEGGSTKTNEPPLEKTGI